MSYCVGSVPRKELRAEDDGVTVSYCKAAGGIPLLVSNTPEYCTSWESSNKVNGRSLNPYDTRRSSGGSSGGEGALIGSGASLFGVGSDIAGSIRVPAMFNGIFGHKPTGGLLSVEGHFPYSKDGSFKNYLVVGPMCRYAKDLPTLMHIMAGPNADKLRLNEPLYTKDIKVSFDIFPHAQHQLPFTVSVVFFHRCSLDFLQRGFWFLVGRHSSSTGNEGCDAPSRQALSNERSRNEQGIGWITTETHRMWTRTIFPNARYSDDCSRWQRHTETGQHFY